MTSPSGNVFDDPRFSAVYQRVMNRWSAPGWESLSESERRFIAVTTLLNEVANGGLHQYFFNSYSDHAILALTTLRSFKADAAARILSEAIGMVLGNTQTTLSQDQRQDVLDQLSDPQLERLDTLAEELLTIAPAVWQRLMAEVQARPSDFGA